ncbi:MAG: transposase, partial [Nostoc indistinguendum CM1-VF10]|nr:transposase [Nostoc indistinguendum CM1-VF10]
MVSLTGIGIWGSVNATTMRRMNQIILSMLAMSGRVTMLGISRWTGTGGSYRTML